MKDKDLRVTLFVGGARHGRTVPGQPSKEGELYRVPARDSKDTPTDYKAAEVTLTFPHPVTGEPGDTFSCFVYTIPDLYPDNPQRAQQMQQALMEGALRHYIMGNGLNTTGGPEAVAAQRIPELVAWCDECPPPSMLTFDTLKERAGWMAAHKTTMGHTASWENRTKG